MNRFGYRLLSQRPLALRNRRTFFNFRWPMKKPVVEEPMKLNGQVEKINGRLETLNNRVKQLDISISKELNKSKPRCETDRQFDDILEITQKENGPSDEDLVNKCVEQYWLRKGMLQKSNLISPYRFFTDDDRKQTGINGYFEFSDRIAVVETKSKVREDSLKQLEKSCKLITSKFGKPTEGYLGGPFFDEGIKYEALKKGFHVVELSGERYRVISPEDEDDDFLLLLFLLYIWW